MKCNKCNIELEESWKYCPMCATSKEDLVKEGLCVKDNKWIFYVLVSLVLFLITGILSSISIYFLFGLIMPYIVMIFAKKKYSNKVIIKVMYFIFSTVFKLILVVLSLSLALDMLNKVTAM